MFLLSNENYFCMQRVCRILSALFILLWQPCVLGGVFFFFLAVHISIKESKWKPPITLCPWSVLEAYNAFKSSGNFGWGVFVCGELRAALDWQGTQGAVVGVVEGGSLKTTTHSLAEPRCFWSYSRWRSFIQKSPWKYLQFLNHLTLASLR